MSSVGFNVLTHKEDPTRNYRKAFQEQFHAGMEQYHQWRAQGGEQVIVVDEVRRPVKYATDQQIRETSWREARQAVERAIIECDRAKAN